MGFRKFSATQLFDGYKLSDEKLVLITTTEGIIENILPLSEAGDDIEYFTGILTPGFVNCHCHLELSHMKGQISQGTGLVKFVSQVMKDRHCERRGYKTAILSESEGTVGGYKEVQLEVTGDEVYGTLKFESGVYRVQRVPDTETSGRVHTSAATVASLCIAC